MLKTRNNYSRKKNIIESKNKKENLARRPIVFIIRRLGIGRIITNRVLMFFVHSVFCDIVFGDK